MSNCHSEDKYRAQSPDKKESQQETHVTLYICLLGASLQKHSRPVLSLAIISAFITGVSNVGCLGEHQQVTTPTHNE